MATRLEGASTFSAPLFDFSEAIRTHARSRPDDPAFIAGDHALSWREFDRRVAQVADLLADAGVRKGDRVALLGANSFWTYEILFGVPRAGAVAVPLSSLLPPTLLARQMLDSGACMLFAGAGHEETARATVAETSRPVRLELKGADPLARRAPAHGPPALSYDDPMSIIYSSGTTNVPKGIIHSLGARLALAHQCGAAFGVCARSRAIIATPPSSNGTMLFVLPTVLQGGACLLMDRFSPEAFFDTVARNAPTHAFLVPVQFKALFEHERLADADLSSLRCLLSAGSTMPAGVKQRVLETAAHCFHELWGFTEGVGTVIFPGEVAARPLSVGRPLSGTEIRLIDEKGVELAPPACGEIVGRSTGMMLGYLNRPDANEEIRWTDAQGAVFLRTGDIGEIDTEGFLTVRGRAKEMIISGGLNVYPIDIEAALRTHPEVIDAAVVGVPDERWGEVPVAFVICAPQAGVSTRAVMDWVNARVAKHQRIADLVVATTDFARNALGKVLKNELRSAYLASRA